MLVRDILLNITSKKFVKNFWYVINLINILKNVIFVVLAHGGGNGPGGGFGTGMKFFIVTNFFL